MYTAENCTSPQAMGNPASTGVRAASSTAAMKPAMAANAATVATGERAAEGMAMPPACESAAFTAAVSMCLRWPLAMNSVRSGSMAASLPMASRRLSARIFAPAGSAGSMVARW